MIQWAIFISIISVIIFVQSFIKTFASITSLTLGKTLFLGLKLKATLWPKSYHFTILIINSYLKAQFFDVKRSILRDKLILECCQLQSKQLTVISLNFVYVGLKNCYCTS